MRKLVTALVAMTGTARADAVVIHDLPESCRAFASVPEDVRDDTFGWNQLLSLAGCVQDDSIVQVTTAEALPGLVVHYIDALTLPLTLYLGAIDRAPGPIQLRAAYQLGMAHVAIAVRARRSIPADPLMRARLEQLLVRPLHIAAMTFAVIDRAVAEDPTLAPDAVTRAMVRSARAMRRQLPEPREDRDVRYDLARRSRSLQPAP